MTIDDRRPLPESWEWTTLGEISRINFRDPALRDLPDDLPVTFLRMAAVDAETGKIVTPEERPLKKVRKGFTPFSEGDVLFAKITPSMENGKAAIALDLKNKRGFGSTEFHVFNPKSGVLPKWIFYFIRQKDFRREAKANFAGTAGQLRVPKSFLEKSSIPLPPLAEQHRIVEAIETQFTRLEAGLAALKQVQARLKRYRAAVLKAACEGRLVAQDPGDEPAAMLLERILRERRVQWNGKGKYKEPQPPNTAGLPELPEGWVWVSVDQLVEVGTGATPKRGKGIYYKDGTVPWVTSAVVNKLFVNEASEFITERAIAETNAKLFPKGTLLVAMYGEGKTRGKVSELQIDAATNQALAALIFDESFSIKPYVKIFFQKNYEDIRLLSSGGVQPNLNLSIIRQTVVPLPPLAEQQRIVAEVERRLSVVAGVEAAITANLTRAGRLRQAILKKAFAGELMPQSPDDEPASVLLERIRGKRSSQRKLLGV
ncbi:MAG: restriction endonuclease subunit S [Anaerolineae bacterium]|nr:restriction endonuclease subunit S [Anaerolineae bacterium]